MAKAETWIKKKVIKSDKKYEGYFTAQGELCLVPGKSTQPLLYGYVVKADEEKVRALFRDTDIPIYSCDVYDWSAELPISGLNK